MVLFPSYFRKVTWYLITLSMVMNTQGRTGIAPPKKVKDHYTFPGNCPPTPPQSQYFALYKWEVSIDVGLGKGLAGSFPDM